MTDSLSSPFAAPCRLPALCGTITYLTGAEVSFAGDQAMACSVSEGAQSGFLLGGAFSAACSLTLNNQDGAFTAGLDPYGAQVRLKLRLADQETPLCVFTVSRVVRRERDPRLTLSGADALGTAFEAAFLDDFSYPLTLGQLIAHLAAQAGFSWTGNVPNGDVVIGERPDWGDISLRQALAYAACAAGSFACIGRDGALLIKPVRPSGTPFAIAPEVTLQREWGDALFGPLKGLVIACKDAPRDADPQTWTADDTPLNASNALSISGNPLFPYENTHTQTLAQGLLSALTGLTLVQVKVSWRGDPALTLGDPVRITDLSGRVTDTLVTRQTLAFSLGFSMQSDCVPPIERPAVGRVFTSAGKLNAALLSGSFSGRLIREGTLSAQALMAGSVTAAQLAAGSITAGKIAADAVQATHLSASALQALDARISSADIGFAQIKDLAAGTALITQGVTGKYYIADLSVTDANIVSLAAGQILVKDSQGNFRRITLDAQGNITTPIVQVSNGNVENLSINAGEKLIEGSVTAATLNARDIFADSASILDLIAANLNVSTLFARQATVDAITAMDISGNQSLRLYVQGSSSRNFTQWDDPALTDTNRVKDGDIWNRSNALRTWRDLSADTWSAAGGCTWRDLTAGRQYIRRSGTWELMNDPAEKYTVRSGINILPEGIVIDGGRYIRLQSGSELSIRTGGAFTVESGNFSIDSSGNVTLTGVINAVQGGSVANWRITSGLLQSGEGSGFVALSSDPDTVFAIWAGGKDAASAPFRITRDGTAYVTRLVTLAENGGSNTVNLQNFPLWKLWYHGIKSYSASGITLTNGDTINFNTAASVILRGTWSGHTFAVDALNQNSEIVASKSETLTPGVSTGNSSRGELLTINAFDSSHKAQGYVISAVLSNRLYTFNVDASGEYSAGWNAALDACTAYSCYTGTVKQLYDPDLDVFVNAVTNYSAWTLFALPDRISS